jgi:hypothetical protein
MAELMRQFKPALTVWQSQSKVNGLLVKGKVRVFINSMLVPFAM